MAVDNLPSNMYTPKEREGLSKLAPLVDEVLYDLSKEKLYLVIDEVLERIKDIFGAKKQDYVELLGYYPWIMLIRGRMLKMGFELKRSPTGEVGWCYEPVGE